MRVAVDRTRCASVGMCEAVAPDVFEVDSTGTMVLLAETVPADRVDDVEEAVENCPTLALRLEAP